MSLVGFKGFKASLDKFAVPKIEQAELFTLVESTKADIVVQASEPSSRAEPCPRRSSPGGLR